MSILKKTLISAGVAASVFTMGSAQATAYFTVNSGYGTTSAFNVLESNVDATSLYSSPLSGLTSFDSLIGIGAFVTDTSANGNVTGFLNNTQQLLDANDAGFGSNFELLFSYSLSGTAAVVDGGFPVSLFPDGTLDFNGDGLIDSNPYLVGATVHGLDAIIPNYTSGSISITYRDLTGTVLGAVGATQKVLELDLISAQPDGTNVVLYADVDYSWYTAGSSALVEDMFHFVGSTDSWYDYWLTSTPSNPISIITRSDFNIDPNKVPTSTACPAGTNAASCFSRTTNLNVTTTVPEPGTLALAGLGLLGLGFSRRRKNAA